MSATLQTKHSLARSLNVDPRTLTRVLRAARINPDFTAGHAQLFTPSQVPIIRRQLRAHVPFIQ